MCPTESELVTALEAVTAAIERQAEMARAIGATHNAAAWSRMAKPGREVLDRLKGVTNG